MQPRLFSIVTKETQELSRDPLYLGLAFFVPMVIMFLFGYGLSLDVDNLPVVFVTHDRGSTSRDYQYSFTNSKYFRQVGTVDTVVQAEEWLKTGRARVIIDFPTDFGRKVANWDPVQVGVTVDGSFPTRAEIIQGYTLAINDLYNQRLRENTPFGEIKLPVEFFSQVWFNPSLESQNSIVPGMIVLNLMMFPALLGSLLLTREKETGTIFNYYSSPVSRVEILAGKAIPYIGVAFLEYLLLLLMGLFLFRVRFVGSLFVLTASTLLYSTCTVGVGLLVSVLTRTQLAAMLVIFLATVTPAFNFSGFTAPVASQDNVGKFIAGLIPATYFMEVVRGCFMKGLGFSFYWPNLRALLIYTGIIYFAAWWFLKKRID